MTSRGSIACGWVSWATLLREENFRLHVAEEIVSIELIIRNHEVRPRIDTRARHREERRERPGHANHERSFDTSPRTSAHLATIEQASDDENQNHPVSLSCQTGVPAETRSWSTTHVLKVALTPFCMAELRKCPKSFSDVFPAR